jgi:hypothetical protein
MDVYYKKAVLPDIIVFTDELIAAAMFHLGTWVLNSEESTLLCCDC